MIPGRCRFVAGAGSEPEVALGYHQGRLHKLSSPWMSGCSLGALLSLCNNQLLSCREPVGQQRGSPARGQLLWVPVEPSYTRDANLVRVCRAGGHRSPTFGMSAGSNSEIRPTNLISIPTLFNHPELADLYSVSFANSS